jgi:hypothetical protein
MSSKAITARLRQTSQLRRLCLSLAKAKPISATKNESDTRSETPTTPQQENPDEHRNR